MRVYDGYEVEDYDEYEEEGEEQYEEAEEGEEEYEEEEERKPTKEELEYLELRQRLKESIRKDMKKESGSALSNSQERRKKLPYDNYGSFFGPSQPVIAQRVIQESKSFLENQHLASRVLNSNHGTKKSTSSAAGSRHGVCHQQPKAVSELKKKVQKLKDTRDYSFLLSDDAEIPAPAKASAPRKLPTQNSEARSAQVPLKSKQPVSNGSRHVQNGHGEKKSVSSNGQMHSKVGPHKSTSASRPNSTSLDPRKQLGSNNGYGPGRPAGPKGVPSKAPVATMEKKVSVPVAKSVLPATHRPASSKVQSSAPNQQLGQKKGLQEPSKGKMVSKQPVVASKPQIKKPLKQVSSHATLPDTRPKKKPVRQYSDDEDENALSIIRKMFRTDRFAGRDDDDSDMEANFDDIMREERRSAKLAREEDEEQLRLIEEEERRERMRKMAKKRKLSQQ